MRVGSKDGKVLHESQILEDMKAKFLWKMDKKSEFWAALVRTSGLCLGRAIYWFYTKISNQISYLCLRFVQTLTTVGFEFEA